jgi:tRNA(adenine34) deaminase
MANEDSKYISRAIQVALEAEEQGNLPVGALITLEGAIIAEGGNSILTPAFHPGRHAEVEALRNVPLKLWPRSREMTCYSTLEPCVMCFGALLLHGLGRVVYGAEDREGGATAILEHLPRYYGEGAGVPEWVGPIAVEECRELYRRAAEKFERLPVVGKPR